MLLQTLIAVASLGFHVSPVVTAPSTQDNAVLSLRQDAAQHCVDDNLGPHSQGNLYCVGSDGFTVPCVDCLGLDGEPPLSHSQGGACYFTTGGEDGSLGMPVSCPGDPPPSKTPDGSDPGSIEGDYIDAWCQVAGSGGLFGWANWAACYFYGLASAGDQPLEQGEQAIKAICDTVFSGLCTCFDSGACGGSGGGGTG